MQEEQYDKIGDTFAQNKAQFFETEKDFAREYILSKLHNTEGKTLIDIGCGAGEDVALYETMPFLAVYGIDPSQVMVDKAKAIVRNPGRISVGDYEHTGLPEGSVDFIVARYSLHYLQNFDNAYAEMARILKPGGVLIEMVDHPVADYVEGERFQKNGSTYVRIKLYKGKVSIEFPLHNFSDYFSPTFFKHFELQEVVEHTGTDREFQAGPNALGYLAIKK